MTISATDVMRGPYAANGVTTEFDAPYILSANDLIVFTQADPDSEATPVSDEDYTVEGVDVLTGSTVVFNEAPADGYVVIIRDPARKQDTRFVTGARFPAESNEDALDRQVMAEQHTLHTILRSLRVPQYEEDIQPPLPTRDLRSGNGFGTLAGFDGNGDVTIYTPETPAIIRIGDIWLKYGEYGPCFNGNAVEDTIAMIAASNAASGTGRKIITRGGRLIFRTNPTPMGLLWGRDGYTVRRSIPLLSNVHYDLRDTLIMSAPHPDMPPFHREDHEDVDGVQTVFAFNSSYTATSQLWVGIKGPGADDRFVQQALTTDYTVSAPGATGQVTFLVAPTEGSTVRISTERAETWIFGTAPNRTASALNNPGTENVVFQDVTWDFGAEFYDPDDVTTMPVIYGIGATSIRGLTREGCKFFNSSRADYETGNTPRRGRGAQIENFADLKMIRDTLSGITQGFFGRYGNGMTITGARPDDVVEAYDCDGPIDDVTIADGEAHDFVGDKNEQDFFDFGGGKRWTVRGIKAKNIGRPFGVYRKPHEASPSSTATMAEGYEKYLELKGYGMPQSDRANFMVTESIEIDDIQCEACAVATGDAAAGDEPEGVPGAVVMLIGNPRTPGTWSGVAAGGWDNTALDGLVGIRNVKLTRATFINCGPVLIGDCEDVQVARLTLVGSRSPNLSGNPFRNAAITFMQSVEGAASYESDWQTRLTGSADTIEVVNSQGVGIMLAGVSDSFVLKNPSVKGFNTLNSDNSRSGIACLRNGLKPTIIRMENALVTGGNSSSDALIRVGGINPSAWATATAYVRGQPVNVQGINYTCTIAHTSGTFSTDLAAGKWIMAEYNIEFIGRPRLEPANGAIPLMLSEHVGHRVSPMKELVHPIFDTTTATGATPVTSNFGYQARYKFLVTGFYVVPQENLAGDAANFTRLSLFKIPAGATESELTALGYIDIGATAVTAGVGLKSSGVAINNGSTILNEGDRLRTKAVRQGNGGATTVEWPLVINGFPFISLST